MRHKNQSIYAHSDLQTTEWTINDVTEEAHRKPSTGAGCLFRGSFLLLLKSSRNKKDLNDVTAAPFLVVFLLLAAEKKTSKMGQL